ncbi:zinc-finger of the MIZ type in Nse subunit-domain-containing protein [Kalaharituber pfeilii]|nr:zinc-finger of the MIZ type in Nse subunit-domain-containing protein [Kalaharituber pfeilii]
MMKRYGNVAEYVEFRKVIWEAQHSGEPMPPQSQWFPDAKDSDDLVLQGSRIPVKCPITLLPFVHPVTSALCPHSFEKSAILEMIRKGVWARDIGSDEKPQELMTALQAAALIRSGKGERCIQCPAAGCPKWLAERNVKEDKALERRIRRERERMEREEVGTEEKGKGKVKESGEKKTAEVGEDSFMDAEGAWPSQGVKREKEKEVERQKVMAGSSSSGMMMLDMEEDEEEEDNDGN